MSGLIGYPYEELGTSNSRIGRGLLQMGYPVSLSRRHE